MPLLPEALVDEVQARADIVEVIGRVVPLKRAGRHFKAHCPFHQENTPSFMVNTEKQIFHCFGCGVGGNVFSFLMQHDRLTFPEAVRQLAEHVGVPVPERESTAATDAQARLVALMEKACRYFERRLHGAEGRAAQAYVRQRGVTDEARRVFRLGFAPAGWDHLLGSASTTGVSPEELEAAGLVIRGRARPYDRFRNRLVFPILDVRDRVVGFGGRSLDAQEPKYLNSPETALYTKGRHLFGLAQAKAAIARDKTAVVVEGYFDCVVLASAGIAHVVSPLGTALTMEQARLLRRYAEQVILAFDADAAGEEATWRGIDVLVELGLQVHVAQLPPGVDPDELVRQRGREQLEQLLGRSIGVLEFLMQTAVRRFPPTTSEARVQAAHCVLPTIAKVPNAMLRSEYVRVLAQRLQLDEAAVTHELSKAQPRALAGRVSDAPRRPAVPPSAQGPERLLTALVLDATERWTQRAHGLSLEDITDPALRRILRVTLERDAGDRGSTAAQVISRLAAEGDNEMVSSLVELAQSVAAKETAFDDCVRRLRASAERRALEQLRAQIQSAQDAGNEGDVQQLLAAYQQRLAAAAPSKAVAVH